MTITARGRAQAPELLHRASDLLAELSKLDETGQRGLLYVVTSHIRRLQRQGQIPVVKMCLTRRFFDGYAHPGAADPHHCRLVDAPFGHQLLRLRCQSPAHGNGYAGFGRAACGTDREESRQPAIAVKDDHDQKGISHHGYT